MIRHEVDRGPVAERELRAPELQLPAGGLGQHRRGVPLDVRKKERLFEPRGPILLGENEVFLGGLCRKPSRRSQTAKRGMVSPWCQSTALAARIRAAAAAEEDDEAGAGATAVRGCSAVCAANETKSNCKAGNQSCPCVFGLLVLHAKVARLRACFHRGSLYILCAYTLVLRRFRRRGVAEEGVQPRASYDSKAPE